jgi:carboxyl-terminal processing protease
MLSDFSYTTESEKSLKKLMKIAESEEYYDDINLELDALEAKLMHNKDADLIKHQDEISEMLKIEIASRYYYQKGRVIVSLATDPEVKKAIELINNKENYIAILEGTVSKASVE